MRLRRILIGIILCFFHVGCIYTSDEKNDCEIDLDFVSNYIQDINYVLDYTLKGEQSIDHAFQSFVTLEVLTNNTKDLDSLGVLFFESNKVKNDIEKFTNNWLRWLEKNRCYSLISAKQKFDQVRSLYSVPNYEDRKLINKLRIKYSPLLSNNLSEEKKDSIVINRDYEGFLKKMPGW